MNQNANEKKKKKGFFLERAKTQAHVITRIHQAKLL
jgi:hypothetical protein